jgi:two-component system, OmpR family, phosphate regulon sensor histidine kinase PhoR
MSMGHRPWAMSLTEHRLAFGKPRGGATLAVAAAAVVFAGMAALGVLAVGYAIAGFFIVAAAALLGLRGGSDTSGAAPPPAPAARLDEPLQAMLAGLADPVIAIGRDGRVVAFNEPARALAPALRHGEPVSLALRMPELSEAVARVFAESVPQRFQYSERVPVDRWFEAVAAPVGRGAGVTNGKPEPGRTDLVLLSFRDLTPLRRVEEMRADFVANASHELRTPLAALSGFIETLQGPARDDAKARDKFLDIMQEQARRMARLIDDLLSLSRIELNAHRRPDTTVDLVPIVRQVVDGLQTLARDRGVAVEVEASGPLWVLADRDELVRVFENLVENALKYGATGKRVDVTAALASAAADGQAEAQVRVRDYGPGIAPEHLPRLTERFYRVDVRESRAQGGTGLGLALVKHILARHRGRLTIDSTPGAGASFIVHLPTVGPPPGQ